MFLRVLVLAYPVVVVKRLLYDCACLGHEFVPCAKWRAENCSIGWLNNTVTASLENLEMSRNLTAVRDFSKIREMSGKKSCQGKVA